MQYEKFVQAVEQRAGIEERNEAARTSVAVLEELCNRLSPDEARDLLSQLPARLKTVVMVSQSPQPISADGFVDRVARRLDVPPDEARNRVRAVFGTIRRATSQGQFADVLSELDPEYADLLT
jgi:uncharacterized protein (DUF2267 family)